VSLIQVTKPSAVPITLAELKAQVRYYEADEDAISIGYIRSAVDYIEASSGLRLITQSWAYSVDCWPHQCDYLRLPLHPVQSITSITYLDAVAGAPTVLDPGVYSFRGDRITLAPNAAWPSVWHGYDTITVELVAGFGEDHNSVPESLRHAVSLLAAFWWEQRTAASIGPDSGPVSDVPFSVREILDAHRMRAV
jgi:uncharacterized phiE125 gp8 family phage protein